MSILPKAIMEGQPHLAVQKQIQRGLPRMGQPQGWVGIRNTIGEDIRIPPPSMRHLKNEERPKERHRPNTHTPNPNLSIHII